MELVQRLDDYGKPAWIGVMILAFIIFWPAGLAILGYMIWSGRMGCSKHKAGKFRMWGHKNGDTARYNATSSVWRGRSSGNAAFDEYRNETLKRLEDEFDAFQSFLQQLRAARDKEEFDKFMASRAKTVDGDAEQPAVDK